MEHHRISLMNSIFMEKRAKKAAGIPREMILRANFVLGPIDLEKVLTEVREFYKKEALFYSKNDEVAAEKLLEI